MEIYVLQITDLFIRLKFRVCSLVHLVARLKLLRGLDKSKKVLFGNVTLEFVNGVESFVQLLKDLEKRDWKK